ncbi:MAG: NADH-quinone oxidoreductase subunit M, partial [Chitinophagaceae bacterium]
MLGTYFTFPELLIWIPLVIGIICFLIKKEGTVKALAFAASIATLIVSLFAICYSDAAKYPTYNEVSYYWMKYLGNAFHLKLDGTGHILSLLTAVAYPLIFLASYRQKRERASSYYGLMLLAQAGIMGVFSAVDALLFYFFWELALIPVYFLASIWGGEKRIQTTFKFFVYTFAGSLLMLIGIIYIYMHTPERAFSDGTTSAHSFALSSFMNASISESAQG